MNRLQIEAFLKIVEIGSVTKAADALFISQSTLSDRLAKLEAELGVELCVRGQGIKGVHITDKGKSFLDFAKRYQMVFLRDIINDFFLFISHIENVYQKITFTLFKI